MENKRQVQLVIKFYEKEGLYRRVEKKSIGNVIEIHKNFIRFNAPLPGYHL